jgi:hypothetical protein
MHSVSVPSQDELLQVFRRAGFSSYTSLQERFIPALLKGRDLAVEAGPGTGRAVGIVLPLIVGLRNAGPAPRALVLVGAPEDVGRVSRAFARIARVVRDAPIFVPLGEIEDTRREERRIEKGATIVAGTAARVIDHLRRGSLSLKELATLVVVAPEGDPLHDFVKDVQFIVEKIADRGQTIVFSGAPLAEDSELNELLRHPQALSAGDAVPAARATPVAAPRAASPGPAPAVPAARGAAGGHLAVLVDDGGRTDERARQLARVLLGLRVTTALVYHPPRADGAAIAAALQAAGLRAAAPGAGRGLAEKRAAADALARRALDVLVVPMGNPGGVDLPEGTPTHIVFFDAGASRPAQGRVRAGAVVLALVDRAQEKEITRLAEAMGVTMTRAQVPGNEDVLSGAIDRIVSRMGSEDAAQLAWLRAQIRRRVPLLKRPLFMAALLKAQLPPFLLPPVRAAAPAPAAARPAATASRPSAPSRPGQGSSSRPPAGGPSRPAGAAVPRGPEGDAARAPRGRFGRNPSAGPAPQRAARPAAPAAAAGGTFAQLFVSIGRNRRVFARDLTALFTETLSLAPGDLGGVRVFEKYSFVDIVPARADEAISKLSGTEVKGRTITVNFAKKKEDKEGA